MAIHSQLISCSASEVAAMIDGTMRQRTSMEVEGNYVDSHGQSEVGFGISRLLGFDLLPRIKTHQCRQALPARHRRPRRLPAVGAGLVTQPLQLARQGPGRLRRPPQRRHRISSRLRFDQAVEHDEHLGIQIGGLPARPGPPNPVRRARPAGQLRGAGEERVPQHRRGLGHPSLTALSRRQVVTALPHSPVRPGGWRPCGRGRRPGGAGW